MVEVAVRIKKMGQMQVVACYVATNGVFFLWIERAAIDKGGLAVSIVDEITVLINHIDYKTCDFHHSGILQLYKDSFFSLKKFLLKKLLQIPNLTVLGKRSYLLLHITALEADKPVGKRVVLLMRHVLAH